MSETSNVIGYLSERVKGDYKCMICGNIISHRDRFDMKPKYHIGIFQRKKRKDVTYDIYECPKCGEGIYFDDTTP